MLNGTRPAHRHQTHIIKMFNTEPYKQESRLHLTLSQDIQFSSHPPSFIPMAMPIPLNRLSSFISSAIHSSTRTPCPPSASHAPRQTCIMLPNMHIPASCPASVPRNPLPPTPTPPHSDMHQLQHARIPCRAVFARESWSVMSRNATRLKLQQTDRQTGSQTNRRPNRQTNTEYSWELVSEIAACSQSHIRVSGWMAASLSPSLPHNSTHLQRHRVMPFILQSCRATHARV